ncbi:hypothetical protein GCM10012289_56750 [Nonomuraea cavernae]|uniref:Uncharacterized protein n=1 Tax=Nonomuraea cavernae TaxID=2045107 RepID=A0A918DQH3_9ACTN|nr:hypothetical protein GCM10012289_56750 [Nonomuraea cavernae]
MVQGRRFREDTVRRRIFREAVQDRSFREDAVQGRRFREDTVRRRIFRGTVQGRRFREDAVQDRRFRGAWSGACAAVTAPSGAGAGGRLLDVVSGRVCDPGGSHGWTSHTVAAPGNGQIKIGESNTVSIELPYDVVHHAADIFEEDSNNCLKMIFNSDTVAVSDMETTDRRVRR